MREVKREVKRERERERERGGERGRERSRERENLNYLESGNRWYGVVIQVLCSYA